MSWWSWACVSSPGGPPDELNDLELTTLELDVGDDGVATVTLNRPDVHNAFDPTMTEELAAVWHALRTTADGPGGRVDGSGRQGVLHRHRPIERPEFGFDPSSTRIPAGSSAPRAKGSGSRWSPR